MDEDTDRRLRIAVVAGEPLRALGLLEILSGMAEWELVALTVEQFLRAEKIAVLLLDSSAAERPLDILAQVRHQQPKCRVILMGRSLTLDEIQAVIAAGAKGYLTDTANESEIRMALEIVLDGSVWAPRKVLARLIEAGGVTKPVRGRGSASLMGRLTKKEMEVMELLLLGLPNRDIAGKMAVREVTVKAHLGRMLRKGGVKNRVALTLKALEERQIDEAFPESSQNGNNDD